jgi:hypothetical protein
MHLSDAGLVLQLSLEGGRLTELHEVGFLAYEDHLPAMIVGIQELERLGVLPWQVLGAGASRVDTSATEETVGLTDEVTQGAGDQDDVRAG